MDIRHPFKEDDLNLIDWCESKDLPMILLLNKSDKLSNNKVSQAVLNAQKDMHRLTTKHYIIATSATEKTGISSLLRQIQELN